MESDSVSGRAVTSALPLSDAASDLTAPTTQDSRAAQSEIDPRFDGIYVPHVYDFVSIFRPAHFQGRSQIPPQYLEPLAVDQSVNLGHGASFTTFKRAVPDSASSFSVTARLEGLTISIPASQSDRQRTVVYKVARVGFSQDGTPTPQTRPAMKAALMELYCLQHRPLQTHPNIVKLLGLAWGSNYFNPSHRLPVAVVEFADRGNLAQLQESSNLGSVIRRRLAIDIGEGLDILHRCGIIHGDVKSENILIFSDPQKEYVAKLSDFGFSLVGEATNAEIYVGGTRPWKAPEAKAPVPKHLLRATDVYSYGLLLWRLATDGRDPFRFWVKSDLHGELYHQMLERLKEEDRPVQNTALDKWLFPYLLAASQARQKQVTLDWLQEGVARLQALTQTQRPSQPGDMSTDDWDAVIEYLSICSVDPSVWGKMAGLILQWAGRDSFYSRISSAMTSCLSLDPTKRNLREALDAFNSSSRHRADENAQENAQGILLRISYDNHVLSWQQMRELEPAVQSFVFNCFKAKVEGTLSQKEINPPECFILMSYYINGYGTDVDSKEALRLLNQCSNVAYNHLPSRAYVYRLAKFLFPEYVASDSMISNLTVMTLMGSRAAAIDLKEVAPDKYAELQLPMREALAGVGANFFHAKQMLGGWKLNQWINTFDNQQVLVENFKGWDRIADYRVNKRGDRILHLAASAGRLQAIETLLQMFPTLTVDQLNDKGETPLLCACRAGQVATVQGLIRLGADAAAVAPTGECCLHWLVSFEDDEVVEVGSKLVEAGANMRQCTNQKIAYSDFRATIEVDVQIPGTPLNWAVHHDRPRIVSLLLKIASDAQICFDRYTTAPSPLEQAAFYHHVECLELMLEAFDRAGVSYSLEPLLRLGVHSADTFSMILRNGARYKERLHLFLNLGLRKAQGVSFLSGIGGHDTHLLYFAVSEAHDEVVDYLLSDEVKELVESFNDAVPDKELWRGAYNLGDINRPVREDRRTPVLEAIRWNRRPMVELLVKHGADIHAAARNPFSDEMNWTGFHILAAAGHTTNYSELVAFLVKAGLSVDGISAGQKETVHEVESPFLVAVQHNAFGLATTFLDYGGDPNASSCSAGLLSLDHPTSVLGHIVAAAAQHTVPRLRYLLEQCSKRNEVEFIVERTRRLSALHRAAWAHQGVSHRSPHLSPNERKHLSRDEYDMAMNREVMHELLQKWGDSPIHLDARCLVHGRSALHLAVDAGNLAAVELLVGKGADVLSVDDLDLTPVLLAQEKLDELGEEDAGMQGVYAGIITLLLKDK
ncbi:hypothetical protein BDW66DRAFT_166389 [Aspergillus desertorum]